MHRILSGLLALFLTLPQPGAIQRLQSGQWLRFHVVAQDDTEEMQRVKLLVRDAVQACYRENRAPSGDMLTQAQALLPLLTQSARQAALEAGFTGSVRVHLGMEAFDDRILHGQPIPAGDYPALVIRLGDAKGRNWWGLLDPDAALLLACAETDTADAPVLWDWSLRGLLAALFGLPMPEGA